jgi:ribose 1,5-bisphosphate isomerase
MSVEEIVAKIKSMEIRGAGFIGRAAAQALKDHVQNLQTTDTTEFIDSLNQARDILFNTRPTAVSLVNALDFVMSGATSKNIEEIRHGVTSAADEFINNSLQAIKAEKRLKCMQQKHARGDKAILPPKPWQTQELM